MPLVNCPTCKAKISADAEECPYCGKQNAGYLATQTLGYKVDSCITRLIQIALALFFGSALIVGCFQACVDSCAKH